MSGKSDIFTKIFKDYSYNLNILNSTAEAKNNFALIKYWGKEDEDSMIPTASSIAFVLEDFYGTKVEVKKNSSIKKDILIIENKMVEITSDEYQKFIAFFVHFKKVNKKLFKIKIREEFFTVSTSSNIPMACGLASSAAFFAALTKAMFKFYNKQDENHHEEQIQKTIIARTGSISASRSALDCQNGEFVFLNKYKQDSFSVKLRHYFNLYCGVILLDENQKQHKSSDAMRISIKNKNYQKWVNETECHILEIKNSISTIDIRGFLSIAIENSEMLSSLTKADGINYDNHRSLQIKEQIKQEFKNKNNIGFTQDAGPNIKVIADNKEIIEQLFGREKIIISKIL